MEQHPQKNLDAERRALHAVEHHHGEMLAELRERVAALIRAVEEPASGAGADARNALAMWCEQELVPHALAEEGPLYSGPGNTVQGRLLVEGMLAEHQAIVGLVERLRVAQGVQAAATGTAIQELFAVHLDKENRLLMPFIVQSPELSLADSVEGLHELVGHGREHGHEHEHEADRQL
ncbi:hemerythrin domain-containing protein [Arthrobacter sp. HMWF013]|uniref:hemerythrin domain-containing protein n=1 Tax=Arthrobacter sp. HMWF013 TaxID=2056849 RepID=UPI000D3B7334|nr:hemerythrin domain-containing protein [Arthrobacter sp. HMWF013]PTT58719.1 hemerythrin [Arthrobacter sp. HMWF013]